MGRTATFFLIALIAMPAFAQEIKHDVSDSTPYAPRVFPAKDGKKVGESRMNEPSPSAVRVSSDELNVSIPVSVLNPSERLVRGLKKENFSVFVDGRMVEIDSVDGSVDPLNLVLFVDVSPSTDSLLDTVKSLAARLVANLSPNDRVMVASFARNLKVRTDFTTDRAKISKAIQKLEMDEGTSLYTSVAELVTEKIKLSGESVSLIVFTDGVESRENLPTHLP